MLPVYLKMGNPDIWLVFNSTENNWWVQPTKDLGTNLGWACLNCYPPCLPDRGEKRIWKVDDSGKIMLQPAVDISIATLEDIAAAENEISAQVLLFELSAEGQPIDWGKILDSIDKIRAEKKNDCIPAIILGAPPSCHIIGTPPRVKSRFVLDNIYRVAEGGGYMHVRRDF